MFNNTYNGWTNRATWLVNLWMDEDQGINFHWYEQALAASSAYELSQTIQYFYVDYMPEQHGLYSDLMCTVLAEVNWCEIAEFLIDNVLENDHE
jgi:hypothetical protein